MSDNIQNSEEQIKPWCAEEFAKDFLRAWVNTPDEREAIRKMIRLIEADRAAQRQAGREEMQEVLDDYRRLTRELDVALNGDGAAKQASLCDIVAQVQKDNFVPAKRYAALEEAAREAKDILYTRYGVCAIVVKLLEALSDLNEARKE